MDKHIYMAKIKMIITISQNLLLKSIHLEDADSLFTLIDKNRTYLSKWLPWVRFTNQTSDTKSYIESRIILANKDEDYTFCIHYRENNTTYIVGTISLQNINKSQKTAEIGYWLSENKQGLGIITKSCKAILDYAFSNLHLEKVTILCLSDNVKSRAIPDRLNFRNEKKEECTDESNIPHHRLYFSMDPTLWKASVKTLSHAEHKTPLSDQAESAQRPRFI